MKKYLSFLGTSLLTLIFVFLNHSIAFAHHIGVEIMGKEYEPHGAFQHTLCAAITAAFLFFAVYGFVTFIKKFLPEKVKKTKTMSTTEEYTVAES